MRCENPESIRYAQVAVVVEELYKCYTEDYVCVIRKVYKQIRTPRERRACVNSAVSETDRASTTLMWHLGPGNSNMCLI